MSKAPNIDLVLQIQSDDNVNKERNWIMSMVIKQDGWKVYG